MTLLGRKALEPGTVGARRGALERKDEATKSGPGERRVRSRE